MTLRAFVGGLGLAAGTAFSVCSAAAADLPRGPPPPPPVAPIAYAPPVYNWTGIYFGGHLGGGLCGLLVERSHNGREATTTSTAGASLAARKSAATFSSIGSCSASRAISAGPTSRTKAPTSIGDALNTNVPWTSTVTGRVGAAFDRLLLYGKGGLAFAQGQQQPHRSRRHFVKHEFDADRMDRRRRT